MNYVIKLPILSDSASKSQIILQLRELFIEMDTNGLKTLIPSGPLRVSVSNRVTVSTRVSVKNNVSVIINVMTCFLGSTMVFCLE